MTEAFPDTLKMIAHTAALSISLGAGLGAAVGVPIERHLMGGQEYINTAVDYERCIVAHKKSSALDSMLAILSDPLCNSRPLAELEDARDQQLEQASHGERGAKVVGAIDGALLGLGAMFVIAYLPRRRNVTSRLL